MNVEKIKIETPKGQGVRKWNMEQVVKETDDRRQERGVMEDGRME